MTTEVHLESPPQSPLEDMPLKQSPIKKQQLPQTHYRKLSQILNSCESHSTAAVFLHPVDPVALGLPDYFDVIKAPMDISTIKQKLHSHTYPDTESFVKDFLLMINNACTYNPVGNHVHSLALDLYAFFSSQCSRIMNLTVPSLRASGRPPRKISRPIKYEEKFDIASAVAPEKKKRKRSSSEKQPKRQIKPRGLSFEQKSELSARIPRLSPQDMVNVVTILRKNISASGFDADEIELDLDALPAETCVELYDFVRSVKETVLELDEDLF